MELCVVVCGGNVLRIGLPVRSGGVQDWTVFTGIHADVRDWPVFWVRMGPDIDQSGAHAMMATFAAMLARKEPFVFVVDLEHFHVVSIKVLQALADDLQAMRPTLDVHCRRGCIYVPNAVIRGIAVAALTFLKTPVPTDVLGSRDEVNGWIAKQRAQLSDPRSTPGRS